MLLLLFLLLLSKLFLLLAASVIYDMNMIRMLFIVPQYPYEHERIMEPKESERAREGDIATAYSGMFLANTSDICEQLKEYAAHDHLHMLNSHTLTSSNAISKSTVVDSYAVVHSVLRVSVSVAQYSA